MPRFNDDGDAVDSYLPTPDEIEQASAEIRAGWSEGDRLSRSMSSPKPVRCPKSVRLRAEDRVNDRLERERNY